MTAAEMLDFMLQGLAPGVTDCWDLEPNAADPDIYEELYAIAQAATWAVKDRVDALRRERNPSTSVEKLPDFELALGLQYSNTSQNGSIKQRQAQVLGRFRETGGLTLDSLRAVMNSYLNYADRTQIVITEPDRAALKAAHTYDFVYPAALGASTTVLLNTVGGVVADAGFISDMGAQLFINVQVAGSGSSGIIQLVGPDGFTREWAVNDYRSLGVVVGMNTVFDLVLYAPEFAPYLDPDGYTVRRRGVFGIWTLVIKNMDQLNSSSLFVEGVGRSNAGVDGLGAEMFRWSVDADSTKVGAGYDLLGAAAAVVRMNHAHLDGKLKYDGVVVDP